MNNRKSGFYWVLPNIDGADWEVAYWSEHGWQLCGHEESWPESMMYEIDPTPIKREDK